MPKRIEILAKSRMEICHKCDTYEVAHDLCDETKGGCGCFIEAKSRCVECECPKNKW